MGGAIHSHVEEAQETKSSILFLELNTTLLTAPEEVGPAPRGGGLTCFSFPNFTSLISLEQLL